MKKVKNESCSSSFGEMVNETLNMIQTKDKSEKQMEIIVLDLPQMNLKNLKIALNCTTDDRDTILTVMSGNTSITYFKPIFSTILEQLVETKIKNCHSLCGDPSNQQPLVPMWKNKSS